MKHKITLFLLIYAVFLSARLNAQDGANDATFNTADIGFGNGADAPLTTVAVNGDKILIGGYFTRYATVERRGIARINADETLDVTFNPGDGANGDVKSIAVQADGKIIVAGEFSEFDGQSRNNVARLNADGSLDATFNPGEGTNGLVNVVKLFPDGRIVLGGAFTSFNNTNAKYVVVLNTDGTIDASFNSSGINGGDVKDVAMQADGKLIAVGSFNTFTGSLTNHIIRLNTDGTNDAGFAIGTGANQPLYTVILKNGGKILVGGIVSEFNGVAVKGALSLNANGTVDAVYDVNSKMAAIVTKIVLQTDGKILIAGGTQIEGVFQPQKSVMRFNNDNTIDSGFISGVADNIIWDVDVKEDGKIIFAGYFLNYFNGSENYITVVNSDGQKDATFTLGNGTGADNVINDAVMLAGGKMIIGGGFIYYNGIAKNCIARLNEDGSVDSTFSSGSGFYGYTDGIASVERIVALSDGKLLVKGRFHNYDTSPVKRIVRLNADGTLDSSFNFSLSPFTGNGIYDMSVQADGKILLTGDFNNGQNTVFVLRLNANGSIDTTFNSISVTQDAQKIVIQPDGKILLCLTGQAFPYESGFSVVRLNLDGSLDNTFTAIPALNILFVYDLVLQSDGKFIVYGAEIGPAPLLIPFTPKLARFNSDGTLDTTFNVVSGEKINRIWLQPDGKLMVSGSFNDFLGSQANKLVRLNIDGTVDFSFNAGSGIDLGVINSLLFQSSEKMIIMGNFRSYDGVGRNRIARVMCSNSTLSNDEFNSVGNTIMLYRDKDAVAVKSYRDIKAVEVYDISGRLISEDDNLYSSEVSISVPYSHGSVLIVRIKHMDGSTVSKKIYF